MIDHATLKSLSRKLEIDEFTVLREYIQIRFLQEFVRHPKIQKVYFKGGTALRLIYGSSRFSEDLDFTVSITREIIIEILADTKKKLITEMPDIALKPVKTIQGYSARLLLPVSIATQPMVIKLDFSERESIIEPMKSPVQIGVLPIAGIILVEHLSAKEIIAEKVRAILHRQKGRDIFDLWYLLQKNTPFDSSLIQSKMRYYNEKYDLQNLISAIKNFDAKLLDQDLRRFLPISERALIPELKRLILDRLSEAS